MARIAGVDLPRDKRVEIGLTYIYGIGPTRSKEVLAKTGVNPDTRVKDLSDADVAALREAVEGGYQIEGRMRGLVGAVVARSQGRKKLPVRSNLRCLRAAPAYRNVAA